MEEEQPTSTPMPVGLQVVQALLVWLFGRKREFSAGMRRNTPNLLVTRKPKLFSQQQKIAVNKNWTSVIVHFDYCDLVLAVNRKVKPSWDCSHVLEDFFYLRLGILLGGLVFGFLELSMILLAIWQN